VGYTGDNIELLGYRDLSQCKIRIVEDDKRRKEAAAEDIFLAKAAGDLEDVGGASW
jgi:hypothetical protein